MIGQEGLNLIKSFEGFSSQEYICPAGKRTIGYGHVCEDNEYYPLGVTPAEAEEMLLDDVVAAEKPIIKLLEKTPLSGNQYDALVSLVYNIGSEAFEISSMHSYLLARDYVSAAGEFTRWCKVKRRGVKGLLNRRIQEMMLFNKE